LGWVKFGNSYVIFYIKLNPTKSIIQPVGLN